MLVLGLNCCFSTLERELVPELPRWFYHDAAACLLRDGELVGAVEEERLNRAKHTNKFAAGAVRYCLNSAGADLGDVDKLAFFYEEEHTDIELALQYLAHPEVRLGYARELLVDLLAAEFGYRLPDERVEFVAHHQAHAASVYAQSGYEDALVVVLDGNGEQESGTVLRGSAAGLEPLHRYPIAASVGHLYSQATQLLGYRLFDEYKVMGLAPHGDPGRYRDAFRALYRLEPGGDYQLDVAGLQRSFLTAGFRPRRRGEDFAPQHADFAAGLQETLETVVLHVLEHWRATTGLDRLCLAGGVAHNSSLNGQVLRRASFRDVFVDPAAHDSGASVGAALEVAARSGRSRRSLPVTECPAWGPDIGPTAEVAAELARWTGLVTLEELADPCERAADLLAAGAVVGWVQGRSEFGPRALGNRSILADPRPAENRYRINAVVKKREAYRPFAPAVPEEAAADWFDIPAAGRHLGFMSFVVPVRENRRAALGAVTHVDGSARVQVVRRRANERFWRLLTEFGARTGTPVLLNTSFNNFAEPIVQSVRDAVVCFLTTELDALVVGDLLVTRLDAGWRGYLDLIPSLPPTAELRTVVRPGRSAPSHEVRFTATWGAARPVGPELAALLAACDGKRSVRDLVPDPHEPLVSELLEVWEHRLVTLAPAG